MNASFSHSKPLPPVPTQTLQDMSNTAPTKMKGTKPLPALPSAAAKASLGESSPGLQKAKQDEQAPSYIGKMRDKIGLLDKAMTKLEEKKDKVKGYGTLLKDETKKAKEKKKEANPEKSWGEIKEEGKELGSKVRKFPTLVEEKRAKNEEKKVKAEKAKEEREKAKAEKKAAPKEPLVDHEWEEIKDKVQGLKDKVVSSKLNQKRAEVHKKVTTKLGDSWEELMEQKTELADACSKWLRDTYNGLEIHSKMEKLNQNTLGKIKNIWPKK